MFGRCLLVIAGLLFLSGGEAAVAFVTAEYWGQTASGPAGQRGDALSLTWSLASDGAAIPNLGANNLVTYFDAHLGAGPGGTDLTQRPWFHFFSESFLRWSELGGVEFVYEDKDDGAVLRDSPGLLGVRGDVRVGATSVNGAGGTIAFSQFPDSADIVLDTDDSSRLFNPAGDFARLRNALMHEIGHALGLDHVVSTDASFLMEPELNANFLGPQLDDIRGLHYYFGDRFESVGTSLGEGSAASSTPLGELLVGGRLAVGVDAGQDSQVLIDDVDFVSIHSRIDVDVYSFTLRQPARITATVTPGGGKYRQAPVGEQQLLYDVDASNNLNFELTDGALVMALGNLHRAGEPESIVDFRILEPGDYFLRVSGTRDAVQLYTLEVLAQSLDSDRTPEPRGLALAAILAGLVDHRSARRRPSRANCGFGHGLQALPNPFLI